MLSGTQERGAMRKERVYRPGSGTRRVSGIEWICRMMMRAYPWGRYTGVFRPADEAKIHRELVCWLLTASYASLYSRALPTTYISIKHTFRMRTKTTRTARNAALALLLFGFLALAPNRAQAQFVAGGGLAIGTEDVFGGIGIQANGYYSLPGEQPIRVGGDVTIFFPGDNVDFFTVNLNGHYLFYDEDGLSAYGIAGLNIATLSVDLGIGEFFGVDDTVSDTEVGLNIGGGVEYDVEFGFLFGEIKFVVSNADQLVLTGGLRFPIGGN